MSKNNTFSTFWRILLSGLRRDGTFAEALRRQSKTGIVFPRAIWTVFPGEWYPGRDPRHAPSRRRSWWVYSILKDIHDFAEISAFVDEVVNLWSSQAKRRSCKGGRVSLGYDENDLRIANDSKGHRHVTIVTKSFVICRLFKIRLTSRLHFDRLFHRDLMLVCCNSDKLRMKRAPPSNRLLNVCHSIDCW